MNRNSINIRPIEHWLALDAWTIWEATVLINFGNPDENYHLGELKEVLPEWYQAIERALISNKLPKLKMMKILILFRLLLRSLSVGYTRKTTRLSQSS